MNADQLREIQAPLKQRYRDDPTSAVIRMSAQGSVSTNEVACQVQTCQGTTIAGLHSAAGGDGTQACSVDMLLQSLVACSGVTLAAVATALSIPLQSAQILAEAELDFRGTLGVDRAAPVGIVSLWLNFQIASPADDGQLSKLVELTERYCVVLRTLAEPATVKAVWTRRV